ncbi:MAG: hypothetical protein DRO99_02615 [Candidatus Aenigmatarchaeota archaeon]|nr:MAG: hypothetical protein DRO99_02615 [Candidatus Aenigmarchaeota archaeon]
MNRKGIATLFLLGVVVFAFFVMNLVMYILVIINTSNMENLFFLAVNANERGQDINAFLSAKEQNTYMESLGNTLVRGEADGINVPRSHMVQTLENMGKDCVILFRGANYQRPFSTVGSCGETGGRELEFVEIPIPGAREGNLKMNMMMIWNEKD